MRMKNGIETISKWFNLLSKGFIRADENEVIFIIQTIRRSFRSRLFIKLILREEFVIRYWIIQTLIVSKDSKNRKHVIDEFAFIQEQNIFVATPRIYLCRFWGTDKI